MKPLTLPPLDERWIAPLEEAAGRPLSHRSVPLLVERLSRKYLGEQQELPSQDELAARILFFFARDLHKVVAPLGELVRAGALGAEGVGPLKILDIGAGVGASTLGILLTLASLGLLKAPNAIAQIAWVDVDPKALQRGLALFRAAKTLGFISSNVPDPELHTAKGKTWAEDFPRTEGGWDLIVASNVLTEVLRREGQVEGALPDEPSRANKLTELVYQLLQKSPLHTDGSLLVIEPAMQADARTLQHARGPLADIGLNVFGPCVHGQSCPLLTRERDWCHDDVSVDLPAWLQETARAAGLRYQGLTYSYLTLRKDRQNVRSLLRSKDETMVPGRWVSHPRISKGKCEIFLCAGPVLQRAQQLDRVSKNAEHPETVLSNSTRGEIVHIHKDSWTAESPTIKLDLENWAATENLKG